MLSDGVNLHFLFSLFVSATCVVVSLALMQVSGSISPLSICFVPFLLQLLPSLYFLCSPSLHVLLYLRLPSSGIVCVCHNSGSSLPPLILSPPPSSSSPSPRHSHSLTNSLELYWRTHWIVLPSHYSSNLNEDAIQNIPSFPPPSYQSLLSPFIPFIFISPFLCFAMLCSFLMLLFPSFLRCILFFKPPF